MNLILCILNFPQHRSCAFLLTILLFIAISPSLKAQTELMAWGNLNGIRVQGQLMEFETSLRLVGKGWTNIEATGKEKQRPKYKRNGKHQTVTTKLGNIEFIEEVIDNKAGNATINLNIKALEDTVLQGVYFCISVPDKYYSTAKVKFLNASSLSLEDIDGKSKPFKTKSNKLTIESKERSLFVGTTSKTPVFIKRETGSSGYYFYFELAAGKIKKGKTLKRSFTITAKGEIDNSPVEIGFDFNKPGRKFAGLGGNFRLQNPKADPKVISYCLENLRVAWGRVEMPWQFWHPNENEDPIEAAQLGKLHQHVHNSMLMAQRLAKLGMPVIVSDWQAPAWAIIGKPEDAYRFRSQGIFGYPLNPKKKEKIYKSIADYLVYLKNNYGVEAVMFSFNESDLGINVRHTGKEHALFIKEFGEYMASRGLATKMLLGDNSDANTFDFILPAMDDPETHKYIGAVSFHSWRGCTDEMLNKWAGAAKKLNVPLIVGEGSTDAAAWQYPDIFKEQSFALYEINLYTRLCAICQPLSILQWQLTSDYSILTGDGIYGEKTKAPLATTQRYWNLKQLASTPEDAFVIPHTKNKETINCVAFANIARQEYAVHIVNNGAKCEATLKGLPKNISKLKVYVTNSERDMDLENEIVVENGAAKLVLPPASFVSLFYK